MIKSFLWPICLLMLSGCSQRIDLNQLDGYWEIREVNLENGRQREYKANFTIDYIEMMSDSSGIRKKLNPKIDGTFEASELYETIKIIRANGGSFIKYKTPLMEWKEEIIKLNEDELILKNEQSIIYIYHRFKPYNLQ